MAEEIRPMHPEAKVPLDQSVLERPTLLQNLEESMTMIQAQDKQLKQFQKLTVEQQQEIKKLNDRMKQFEIFEPILKKPLKYYTAYLRNPVVIQMLRGRIRKMPQFVKATDDLFSVDKDERKMAHFQLDAIIEECVAECVFNQWHRIIQRLKDKEDAPRPTVA